MIIKITYIGKGWTPVGGRYSNISILSKGVKIEKGFKSYISHDGYVGYIDTNHYNRSNCNIKYIRHFMKNMYPEILKETRKRKLLTCLKEHS